MLVYAVVATSASAADAGSPAAAIVAASEFLGSGLDIQGAAEVTPDDKALVRVKHGDRACSVTLLRRASTKSGWKIAAQNCKPKKK